MRTIVHVDLDAFFAAVEILRNPALRGKPVIVGGDPRQQRGVVATCSYEARAFGIRSAMPIREAVRRCPHAVFLRPNMEAYRTYSHMFFKTLSEFSPVVEALSVDEAFVDMTGCEHFYPSVQQIGLEIKRRVLQNSGLVASVGIAHNKFLAKLASDSGKPDGLIVISPKEAVDFLDPLPVERLWGVGPKTAMALRNLGIQTVSDLRERSPAWLAGHVGESTARHVTNLASGIDDRPVEPLGEAKSISREITFDEDTRDPETIRQTLADFAADLGTRLRHAGLWAGTVSIKVRYPDFTTLTRQRTLSVATQSDDRIFAEARSLISELVKRRPLRLIGVGAGSLSRVRQESLFDSDGRSSEIDRTLDHINQKLGARIVRRGRELKRDPGQT